MQALKYWTILPAPPDTPDPSETGSSLKGALPHLVLCYVMYEPFVFIHLCSAHAFNRKHLQR